MKWREILRVAAEAIWKNSVRSILTMLGVIIGVAAVIVMVAVSAGTEATIQEEITSLGTNLLFVQSNFARGGLGSNPNRGLVFDDATAIAEQVKDVAGVVVEQNASANVKANGTTLENITILGTTPDFPSVRDIGVAEGRYFNQLELDRKQKVVVLGSSLAEELFGNANPLGETITVGNVKMTVIGVMAPKGLVGEVDYDTRLYMPITVVFQKFTPSNLAKLRGDRVRLIYVEVKPDADPEEVITQIELLLAKRHDVSLDAADFTITTQQDIIATQEATTAAFRSLLAWVAGVSLIVGGIGIMNIMLVSVTERTREIGIRQAIGAMPEDIQMQFLVEALLLSTAGGIIGIALGVGGAHVFGRLSEMRTVIVPESIALAFGSAAVVGAFFGYYPATKAAQLDPIEALRYE